MPRRSSQDSADGTFVAQGRFTVALPREVGSQIDALASRMAESMRQQYGIGVELSRAQVVTSVVQSALKTFEDIDAAGNGDQASS